MKVCNIVIIFIMVIIKNLRSTLFACSFLLHPPPTAKTNIMAVLILLTPILSIKRMLVQCWFEQINQIHFFPLKKAVILIEMISRDKWHQNITTWMGRLWEQLFCPVKNDLKSKNNLSETMTEKLCAYEVISSKLNNCAPNRSSCFVIQQSENQWALCGNVQKQDQNSEL